jgi:drug/metabolite transporter (DMT)-like permease
VYGLFGAWLFLGERMGIVSILGCGMILLALAGLQWHDRRSRRETL